MCCLSLATGIAMCWPAVLLQKTLLCWQALQRKSCRVLCQLPCQHLHARCSW